jgi:hypothetical protein
MFKQLICSFKKSCAMQKIIKKCIACNITANDYKIFFDSLMENPTISSILNAYSATPLDLQKIVERFKAMGYHYVKTDYIPIAVVSFAKPLIYLLENKSIFYEKSSYETLITVMENAKTLL